MIGMGRTLSFSAFFSFCSFCSLSSLSSSFYIMLFLGCVQENSIELVLRRGGEERLSRNWVACVRELIILRGRAAWENVSGTPDDGSYTAVLLST